MIFKGYGSIYNSAKRKMIVDFQKTPEYETANHEEIRLLRLSGYITEESGAMPAPEKIVVSDEKELTKKKVLALLSEAGIKHNPRDKKEVLLDLLEV